MTVKKLIELLKRMPQDKRVYIWYESCDCDITSNDLIYDGQEVCLWSDTGELAYAVQNNEERWDEE